MRLSSQKPETIIHEFAHTLANSSADKYGLTNDTEFWKEIDKVKREYRKDVQQDTGRWISSYEHGRNDKDEFFAEAFTMAKMKEMGLELPDKYGNDFTYSDKVLEITDKYFGKEEILTEPKEEPKEELHTTTPEAYEKAKEVCEVNNIEYREVEDLDKPLTQEEIIQKLAGGDMTKGSCASLAFAYAGNTCGFDVESCKRKHRNAHGKKRGKRNGRNY